ncbi:MAG: RluA family pseudouridine synthase [Spirochaetales bacterium]|nr:RluA family pseudouridine synthase [Spirochaetales bacterium]
MIIFADEYFIAANKKPGVFSAKGKDGKNSIIENLSKEYGQLYPVNRLDAPVSGIILFARTQKAADNLSAQLGTTAEKRYVCAVDNEPEEESGKLENFLLFSGKGINKTYVKKASGKNTKKAVLYYNRICRTDNFVILEILLKTGRKHQIRAQLSEIGCHIRGDLKYGAKRSNKGGGISLHAYSMKIKHPETGEELNLFAPPPEDPVIQFAMDSNLLPSSFKK